MLVDPSSSSSRAVVTGAISQAAQATGTSFNYLLATAQVESGLNPQAGATTTSARGLFQFIEQTWLATMKQSGTALGYGRYADAITRTASGRYEVQDATMRSEILRLRNDAAANAAMAGAFTSSNATILSQRLGRAPSDGELYIAHFLGADGAANLITLADNNPRAKAATFFSGAAAANPSIFQDRSGAARSVAQVRDVLIARYEMAAGSGGGTAVVAQAGDASTAERPAPKAPDTAGIAGAFAAAIPKAAVGDKAVFHGLFQDAPRSSPVAPVVSALWAVPQAAGSGETSAHKPRGNLMQSLFSDPQDS